MTSYWLVLASVLTVGLSLHKAHLLQFNIIIEKYSFKIVFKNRLHQILVLEQTLTKGLMAGRNTTNSNKMKNAEIQLEDLEILSPRTSTIKEIVEEINIRVADRQLTVDRIALQIGSFLARRSRRQQRGRRLM